MDEVLDRLICVLAGLALLVFWRWAWLRKERSALGRRHSRHEAERFDPYVSEDERDRTYSGRVIKRMRTHLVEGRVEIHWEYNPEFIHRGFILTAKCRRNDGEWQPLALEPHQDSGSWIECFNYGESRSYLFTVKKAYRFFFGIFDEFADEIVYDQISFSVRKGKYLKEKKELIRDRKELLHEVKEYVRAEQDIRDLMSPRPKQKTALPLRESRISRLEQRLGEEAELTDLLERKTEEINAHPTWSEKRKREEIQRLAEKVAEMRLEE